MPIEKVNNVQLYYELKGEGAPLVLIAGLSCDMLSWGKFADMLSNYFQVLLFDNRGVGRSECPDIAFTVDDMAEDAMGLIHQLGLKKPHILGHSLGGAIAQTLARKHGSLLGNIVIACSPSKLNPVSALYLTFIGSLKKEGISDEKLAQGIMPWIFSNHFLSIPQNIERYSALKKRQSFPQPLSGYLMQLDALLKFDSSSWYHEIRSPCLVICGEEDLLCPPQDSQKLAIGIPHTYLESIPEMGHTPFLENPEECVEILLDFFRKRYTHHLSVEVEEEDDEE